MHYIKLHVLCKGTRGRNISDVGLSKVLQWLFG